MKRLTVLLTLFAAPAWGQAEPDPWSAPNPFEAHEARRSGAPNEAGQPAEASARFKRGTMLLGGSALFSYTSATNGKPEGGEVENSTLFTRLTPAFGYMITDHVELGIAPGLLLRQIDRGSEGTTNEEAFLVEVTGRYFKPVTTAFSLYGGGGLGGSFGNSERSLVIQDEEGRDRDVTEETSTIGFIMTLGAGAAYTLPNQLQLRAGIELDWLIGTETIDSIKKDLDLSTLNAGLGIGVHYLF